jgi:polyisoprenoid-binding protein YceI
VSILLHFAGALKHHFIDKDATLKRMLPGHTEAGEHGAGQHGLLPPAGALAVWAAALFIGSTLDLYAPKENTVAAAALQAVQSDWAVQDGTLSISVQQMGSQVTGSFADWTAAIRFDETVESGLAGSVDVTVSIGSLSLGSVTNQAMGADFFNAENFPTARFEADILRTPDGYRADGRLTIKDQTMPLSLPFTLEIVDGLARMQGSTSVDRRDYNIGDNQKDEASVGFGVAIDVSLTAREGG